MDTKPTLIVKGRKFEQVLQGARSVFLRDGFERTSVDDIAREAGVSKATLYAYFPDKRILFMEVASAECRRQAEEAVSEMDQTAPIADVLRHAATRLIGFMQSDFGQRIFRIAVAEAESFPELAQQFYNSGPRLAKERISECLQNGVTRGELAIEDLPLAAAQFAQLCKVDLQDCLLFTPQRACTAPEVKRVIEGAVSMFMARYGLRPQPESAQVEK
jgi:TetR/AcrR family transcriptional regulator, mexJK operon transcriptional repressor